MRSIVVMGVAGSGKSTIASALAKRIGCKFIDADRLHTPENLAKMSAGHALNDVDRFPWLHSVGRRMKNVDREHLRCVVACSALKRTYRDILRDYVPDAFFVFLDGSLSQMQARIAARSHGVPASLLTSQFNTLERLQDDEQGIRIDISLSPDDIVNQIVDQLEV
jgi:carbohydrate kinase (thermoresistant glucokinase family)